MDAEEASEPGPGPLTSADEPQSVERTGVGLLAISEALIAASLAAQLLVVLLALVTTDGGVKKFVRGCGHPDRRSDR